MSDEQMRRGPTSSAAGVGHKGEGPNATQKPVASPITEFRPVDTPRSPADDALHGRSPGSRVIGLVPPSRHACTPNGCAQNSG